MSNIFSSCLYNRYLKDYYNKPFSLFSHDFFQKPSDLEEIITATAIKNINPPSSPPSPSSSSSSSFSLSSTFSPKTPIDSLSERSSNNTDCLELNLLIKNIQKNGLTQILLEKIEKYKKTNTQNILQNPLTQNLYQNIKIHLPYLQSLEINPENANFSTSLNIEKNITTIISFIDNPDIGIKTIRFNNYYSQKFLIIETISQLEFSTTYYCLTNLYYFPFTPKILSYIKNLNNNNSYIFCPPVINQSLLQMLKNNPHPISIDLVRLYAVELILMLDEIQTQQKKISLTKAYRCFFPAKIFLSHDGHLLFCNRFFNNDYIYNHCLNIYKKKIPLKYRPPESFYKQPRHGIKGDLWQIGVVLFEMLTNNSNTINSPERLNSFNFPSDFDQNAKNLIRQLTNYKPNNRPSLKKVKEDPFFNGIDWDEIQKTIRKPLSLTSYSQFHPKNPMSSPNPYSSIRHFFPSPQQPYSYPTSSPQIQPYSYPTSYLPAQQDYFFSNPRIKSALDPIIKASSPYFSPDPNKILFPISPPDSNKNLSP